MSAKRSQKLFENIDNLISNHIEPRMKEFEQNYHQMNEYRDREKCMRKFVKLIIDGMIE